MKAACIENGKVVPGDLPDPEPGKGQALVRTHACGLCASDAHFLTGGQHVIDLSRRMGGPYAGLDFARPFVPGHEFVGEVIDYGAGSRRTVRPGRRVTSVPIMRQGGRHAVVGFSHECPGGCGELMLLDEDMLLEIPDGMPDDHAALIEPLAVGFEHARRGRPGAADVALVLGCGAIGLGVVAGLRMQGVERIVAADFHAGRRAQALAMGAALAIDPRETDPYAPIPAFGQARANLVYENVGRPGMLQAIVEGVPFDARVVIGGYCMEPEPLFAFAAQNKRLNIQFAGGEEPQDMAAALRAIAEGAIDVTPWLGERIGLSGVGEAIGSLSSAEAPLRTLVDPRLP